MNYLLQYPEVFFARLLEHLAITGSALLISVLLAVPLGSFLARKEKAAGLVLSILGILYTIPSIALMILLLPIFGLNARTVIVALVLYSQVILMRNVIAGIRSIDPAVIETAHGLGMSWLQRWQQVELPLAMPVILAGVRIAAVVSIAIATIGAKFSAGGLGTFLFEGIAQAGRYDKIWLGAISVALLAWLVNYSLLALERRLHAPYQPRGA